MQNDYSWLLKKTPRSVKNLHLWEENPRLNPENTYIHLHDFAEEMTATDVDRRDFVDLAKSIASKGFIPADPIVIWQQEESKKFFVAEGNRRICVLKLLHEPTKAPKAIKAIFAKLSKEIDLTSIDKVYVSIAPNFREAEWYISQRNSISSLQKRWQREQQQRWIAGLYDQYDGDINEIRSQVGVDENELEIILRAVKIKALVKEIPDKLTPAEYAQAVSHRFPISSLERFFGYKKVKDEWGVEYEGTDIKFADKQMFLVAYAALIKRMLLSKGHPERIDSRSITDKLDEILGSLPKVKTDVADDSSNDTQQDEKSTDDKSDNTNEDSKQQSDQEHTNKGPRKDLKNDPNRSRLILKSYQLQTDNFRLADLFKELKEIPLKYTNSIAASIRVYLDLAVLNYLESEGLIDDMTKVKKASLRQITLSIRLEYLKEKIKETKANTVIQKLLNPENELSLDVLNGYVHGKDTHYLNAVFLNKFWDFLLPLFQVLLDIKEE